MESVKVEEARPIHLLGFIGETQSRDAQDHFSAHQEWLTAGRKQYKARTARQKRGRNASTFLNDVFTVVQHQKQVPGLEISRKPLDQRLIRSFGQCEYFGDGFKHQVR